MLKDLETLISFVIVVACALVMASVLMGMAP